MFKRRQLLHLMAALPILGLAACRGGQETSSDDCSPLLLTEDHDCALCGMSVTHHTGPKGQACLRDGRVLPFCSVTDMLSWAWQPESANAVRGLRVHDLSRTDWDQPSEDAWMDAVEAVYVVGHGRRGAMGHSPAPFSSRADAERFASRHGGRLLAFDELDWEIHKGAEPTGYEAHPHAH
ncbi:nitrous oxide reductase accessory protein NosL [Methylonatrum kenyense]|uniref:nitrous oxide reductase accessory protein NosL n=1 Tax=Methylonatrum kenyense TaxID=455253 RepID=UPI0020BDFF8E|nr:nitrous oxide reductase accessory protein NosL [Methylonatrum kenyense]MCK8515835.1 nitrous oxide reductase accessory protein NosL [Methylonatrum kenyense]